MRRALLAIWLCFMALGVSARDLTTDDVEAFTDGIMSAAMTEDHVAGAVVGIVADGRVLLLKGYGYSDIDKKVPVDPQTTLFRPGSVTKLLTWVSLLQLEAAGKVDLHADVNKYLTDVQVPATFSKPITIANLMTHTPGFEDRVIGLFGRDATSMRPLPEVMAEQLPARVRPPGQDASYSNQGAALGV